MQTRDICHSKPDVNLLSLPQGSPFDAQAEIDLEYPRLLGGVARRSIDIERCGDPGDISITPEARAVPDKSNAFKIVVGCPRRVPLAATLSGGTFHPVSGDAVGLEATDATVQFANKDVGQNIAVTASGYPLTGADAGNYDLKQPTGLTATITAKLLRVEVESAARRVGEPNPIFSYKITGFVPGEDERVVTGIQITTSADANSRPGKYLIKASGGSAPNYTFKYVDGDLRISR